MAVQWVLVCTQDIAPAVTANGTLDCSTGTVQVVSYQYLTAEGQAFGGLLNLSNADSAAVGAAMFACFASAWAIKMVCRSLGSFKNDES